MIDLPAPVRLRFQGAGEHALPFATEVTEPTISPDGIVIDPADACAKKFMVYDATTGTCVRLVDSSTMQAGSQA